WTETMNCNYKLRDLAVHVKEGIRAAGGTPMEFNTIAISDGITMGTEGMKASLGSRDIIADSIELVARGHMFDGIVALVACDKTIPGAAMALLRLNTPALILYGGSILPGRHNGRDLTIQDVYEAVGANSAGRMSDEEFLAIENSACPGAGACGGQFTANTMATVMELIGLSPLGTAAMAREAGVPLGIDDFQTISERTPLLVDLKPAGKFVAVDVDKAGGIAVIAQRLVQGGYADGSAMTVTGRTLAAEAAEAKETPGQEVIHPLDKPIKKSGGLVILRGSLAPDGCGIKVTGIERTEQGGPARVFETEEAAMAAATSGKIHAGDIVVIRYEGPRGGP